MCLQVDLIIQNVEEMQESQQRLLDEQLQLSLDTNKTGLSISSHDSQIDVLDQYTKVGSLNFFSDLREIIFRNTIYYSLAYPRSQTRIRNRWSDNYYRQKWTLYSKIRISSLPR